jgi:isoamylase
MTDVTNVGPGRPDPLGATPQAGGVNFALFSYHASQVELLLFDRQDQASGSIRIPIGPGATGISSSRV